jgi:hypothetical protein
VTRWWQPCAGASPSLSFTNLFSRISCSAEMMRYVALRALALLGLLQRPQRIWMPTRETEPPHAQRQFGGLAFVAGITIGGSIERRQASGI